MKRGEADGMEEELARFAKLPGAQRNKEQERLLHNRHAERLGQHVLAPMHGPGGVGAKLVCTRCKGTATIATLTEWPMQQCGDAGDAIPKGPSVLLTK